MCIPPKRFQSPLFKGEELMMFFIAARQSHSPAAVRRIRDGLQGTVCNLIWLIAVMCQHVCILVEVDLLDDADVVIEWVELNRGC